MSLRLLANTGRVRNINDQYNNDLNKEIVKELEAHLREIRHQRSWLEIRMQACKAFEYSLLVLELCMII
ncbi:2167_t:CDS:2 [Funneliformis mosseae]|uniref:2167_t:CDS:1 n=1 Tax=Funneliformis mosseae TaxID=27381 RepID=A0A9N9A9X8_FUNMO|nr:2167_t:CDS:2 [Funneliformis mosseae]